MVPGAGAVQVVGPGHQPLLDAHVIDPDSGASQHHEPGEERQPAALPDEEDEADRDRHAVRPALQDAERAGREPADVLEGQRAEEERERARDRPERAALELGHRTSPTTMKPPTRAAIETLKTSPSRFSMKVRIGSPKRRSSAAIRKKRMPRASRLAIMNTVKLSPVAPDRIVITL